MQKPDSTTWNTFVEELLGEHHDRLATLIGQPLATIRPSLWDGADDEDYFGLYGISYVREVPSDLPRTWFVVTVDHPSYAYRGEGDVWRPVEADHVVIEVAILLGLRRRMHIGPAHERVVKACSEAGSTIQVTPLDKLREKQVALLDLDGCQALTVDEGGDVHHRGIWLYLRSAPFPRRQAMETPSILLKKVAQQLAPQIRTLLTAGLRARGAIDGHTPDFSDDVLTGWCGELVARRDPRTAGLRWIGGDAALDFQGAGRAVEVKSTQANAGGHVHLSEAQVAAVARWSSPLSFLVVRVPPPVVTTLRGVIREKPPRHQAIRPDDLSQEWLDALRLLAVATRVSEEDVMVRAPAIMEAVRPLEALTAQAWFGPQELGQDVLQRLGAAGAALTLPLGELEGLA